MEREKKVLVLAHCILNQNSVVQPLARAKGGYNTLLQTIINNDIGILQLPCPELIYLGTNRPPMSKEEYDTWEYRQLCKALLTPIIKQLSFYRDANYKILGYVGIDQSPTCSINNAGVLMDVFHSLLKEEGFNLPNIAIPTDYHEKANTSFRDTFEEWLNQ